MDLTHPKQEKGITLITLVITIVVLLILAGVSVTMFVDNGLLINAEQVNSKQSYTQVEEQMKLAHMKVITEIWENKANDLTYNAQNDMENLLYIVAQNLSGDNWYAAIDDQNKIITITCVDASIKKESNEIMQTQNGWISGTIAVESQNAIFAFDDPSMSNVSTHSFNKISNVEKTTIGTAINVDKYGYKVSDYNVTTDEFTTGIWRLFYQDRNYTYLITDELVGNYQPNIMYDDYKNGSFVSNEGRKLSPKLLKDGSFFVDSNTDENIRATAWFTDPKVWKDYKNDDALYAIGCPTAELYVASFNSTRNTEEIAAIELGVKTFGYTEDTGRDQLTTRNGGIYNKGAETICWIASPRGYYSNYQLYIDGTKGFFNSCPLTTNTMAVRPVVCIPTSIFESNYTLVNG